jgi:TonB family protein
MEAGAQLGGWRGPSRRRVPRFRMLAPLDVTVLRSGIPDTVPGRALNVCERGIGAILAGELKEGESVGVELRLSSRDEPLRTRATVRYHDKLRYGLEFTAVSPEQRSAIRGWAKAMKSVTEAEESTADPVDSKRREVDDVTRKRLSQGGAGFRPRSSKRLRRSLLLVAALLAIAAVAFWWQWTRSWQELEAGKQSSSTLPGEKPEAQVSADVMQKLLVHRVEPVYPAQARKQRLQGVVALNVVVGRDGSVVSMRPLNGPDILAQAAMDALRWWKFEPYRLNGEPAVIETTLAVEFKR